MLMLAAHVLGAVVWIGGMFFAHFCLRPAAMALEPPQRLSLWTEVLRRFFVWVWVAVALIWISGVIMIRPIAAAGVMTPGLHLMTGIALVMTLIFAFISLVLFPRMARLVAAADWPAAGQVQARIRALVLTNLVLGLTLLLAYPLIG